VVKKKFLFFIFYTSLLFGETLPLFFEGNQQIGERELYNAMNLYKPYFYEFYKEKPAVEPKTVMLLVQTIQNYYRSRGYFHTVVSHKKSETALTILISEEPPIIVADVAMLSKLDITLQIPFKREDVFDPSQFTQSKKDIKLLYENNGYCNALLDAKAWVDIETNYAYLLYEATPREVCYFGSIHIIPSENIDTEIIESLLYIK
jgi:translocation and assembly module TamA